jgi:hypothetical protein
VEQIEHRAAPAGEFCDQNGVDIAGLSQGKDLLSLGALILHPIGSFLPYPDDSIPGFPGEGAEIPFLASAGLVVGGYPAVDRGRLSQLNPESIPRAQGPQSGPLVWQNVGPTKLYLGIGEQRNRKLA